MRPQTSSLLERRHGAGLPAWDWSTDLDALKGAIDRAESGHGWDWRADLECLERQLGDLERRLGLKGA